VSGEHQAPNSIEQSNTSSRANYLGRPSAPLLTHDGPHSLQHQPSLDQLSTQASTTPFTTSSQKALSTVPPLNVWQQQPQPSQQLINPYKAGSLAMDLSHVNQTSQECSSSNTERMVLLPPKRNKENGKSKDGTYPELQKESKRSRTALELQERLAIIEFWEENQNMSMYNISKRFSVPRPTIYGIIKDRERLKQLAAGLPSSGLTPARKSSVESPFRILEELLVVWSVDLRDRGFVVTDKMITAQAFEIHRMLSGVVSKPLPPCKFTQGWLQKFKERRSGSIFATRETGSTIHEADWSFQEDDLRRFSRKLDDVFMCGVVSMYLDALPTRIYDGLCPESEAPIQDSLIVSVLLCCNATGTRLRTPYVFGEYTVHLGHCSFDCQCCEVPYSNVCSFLCYQEEVFTPTRFLEDILVARKSMQERRISLRQSW